MDTISLIISLVSGAVGGNIAGALMKNNNLGTLGAIGNSIAGIVGGGLGTYLLQTMGILGAASGAPGIGAIVGDVASGGVGGAILMAIFGLVYSVMKPDA